MNESSRILNERREEQKRPESTEELEVIMSLEYEQKRARMSKASSSNHQPIDMTPLTKCVPVQAMILKDKAYNMCAVLDKQREIMEMDFGQRENSVPVHVGALPSERTPEGCVTIQLHK